MTSIVLALLLGLTAVLLAVKGAWGRALIAGLLAMAAVYITTEPLGPPLQTVVRQEQR